MEKYTPLQQRAYAYLKEQILNGKLEYGKFYSENKIVVETGFSRTPIKDALTRLCHDKYIDIIPSKGFCLHVISAEDIRNSYQLRTAIEGFCAATLATAYDTIAAKEVIANMKNALDKMKEAIDNNMEIKDFASVDMEFHRSMLSFLKNPEIIELSESYEHRQYEYAIKTFELKGRLNSAYEEHVEIYKAIEKGMMTEAYVALKKHMDKTCEISLSLI